jgi:large subunit ribosomal protein L35
MPKLKTKSGAKKRFKITGSGKIKRKKAYKNHILTKKETKQKRRLTSKAVVKKVDENNIRLMFPYEGI